MIGAIAQGEVKERRIMGPSILTFSELDSGKSLVITKNNLIDVFLDYIKPYLTFLVSRHTRRRNRNVPQ